MPAEPLRKCWGYLLISGYFALQSNRQADSTLSQSAVIKAIGPFISPCSCRTSFLLFETRQVEKLANIAIIALLAVEL